MNRVFVATVSIPRAYVRSLSTAEIRSTRPDLTAIKRKQAQFQLDPDVPVYLKGGTMDKVFYYATAGMIVIVKYLNRIGPRAFRPPFHNILRMTGGDKSQDSCGPPTPAPPCAPPPPPPSTASTCPQPPPCAPMPLCPPSVCPPIVDSNNPCNYCPPPCIDPDYPDLTKLKKLQCHFQKDDGIPVYLKKGNSDAILFQITVVLTLLTMAYGFYGVYKLSKK